MAVIQDDRFRFFFFCFAVVFVVTVVIIVAAIAAAVVATVKSVASVTPAATAASLVFLPVFVPVFFDAFGSFRRIGWLFLNRRVFESEVFFDARFPVTFVRLTAAVARRTAFFRSVFFLIFFLILSFNRFNAFNSQVGNVLD